MYKKKSNKLIANHDIHWSNHFISSTELEIGSIFQTNVQHYVKQKSVFHMKKKKNCHQKSYKVIYGLPEST